MSGHLHPPAFATVASAAAKTHAASNVVGVVMAAARVLCAKALGVEVVGLADGVLRDLGGGRSSCPLSSIAPEREKKKKDIETKHPISPI